MSKYEFTIRAIDNVGSFADRQFSIDVQNANVIRYMMVNNSDRFTSVNGVDWITRTGGGGQQITFFKDRWVIQNATGFTVSFDGLNFFTRNLAQSKWVHINTQVQMGTPPSGTINPISKVVLAGDFYTLLMMVGNTSYFARTKDFLTWEYLPVSELNPYVSYGSATFRTGMTFDGTSLFVGVPLTGDNLGMRSDDLGKTWTLMTKNGTGSNLLIDKIFHINGIYLATCYFMGYLLYSKDAVNWIVISMSGENTSAQVDQIYYQNGRLIATVMKMNNTNAIPEMYQSIDGTSWSLVTSPNFTSVSANAVMNIATRTGKMHMVNGWFTGTANMGPPLTSLDGVTWTKDPNLKRDGNPWPATLAMNDIAVIP